MSFRGLQHLGGGTEIQGQNLGILRPGIEAFRLGLHLHAQAKAVDSLFKAGIVIDLMALGHLTAGR